MGGTGRVRVGHDVCTRSHRKRWWRVVPAAEWSTANAYHVADPNSDVNRDVAAEFPAFDIANADADREPHAGAKHDA